MIIPEDTVSLLEYASDEDIRREAGVPERNQYLFASSSKFYIYSSMQQLACCLFSIHLA